MPDRVHAQPPSRPRALAEMSLDATAARAEELARRWIAALILGRPLEALGELPLKALALEAPALCEQTIRALQSDVELDRLTGQGPATGWEGSAPALRLGAIAGAGDAASAVGAVEALRGVLWEALIDDSGSSSGDRGAARRVADLSDRLAHVSACMLAATLSRVPSALGREPAAQDAAGEADGRGHLVRAEPARVSAAVIVDEHDGDDPGALSGAPAGVSVPAAAGPSRTRERSLSWDESPPAPPAQAAARAQGGSWEPGAAPFGEIEIRDERADAGPAAWIGSIGRELDRFGRDGRPFAVLLLEPDDIERLRDAPEELAGVDARLERVLTETLARETDIASGGAELRPSLKRQAPGRYWLLVPMADRPGAERLAERLRGAVSSAVDQSGRRLEVSLGAALCPEDGRDAPALAAHADVSLYAARSAARLARGRKPASVDERA